MLLTKSPDSANMAVDQVPEVQEAKATLDGAHAAHEEIRKRVLELDRLCAPVFNTSNTHVDPPSRLQVLHGQAALPGLRLKLFESELAFEHAKASHELAEAKAKQALQQTRIEPRREMIAELFASLYEAQRIAKEIEAYDAQTSTLGGLPPRAPACELLDDPYRQSFVQANEHVLRTEGWL